jgi:tRNA uridine 5-carbamoylmethylation protein Kti12
MKKKDQKTVLCAVCRARVNLSEVFPVELVRGATIKAIQEKIPDLPLEGSFICLNDLNRFRREYIEDVLEEERGTLSRLEQEFVDALAERELLSKNIISNLTEI